MNYIVSNKYEDGQDIYGKKAFKNLQDCFNSVPEGSYIYLCNEVYTGKFYLRQKNITIVGMDDTIITYDAYHSEKIRPCDGGDGERVYGTTGSATFTIKDSASGLKMYNVTVINSHNTIPDASNQAVAFKTEAVDGFYEECKFYGLQDTLYVDNNDNVFLNCVIAGSVDFIFGKGNAIFDNCSIIIRSKTELMSFITAPNTYISNIYGYLFYKCRVTAEGKNAQYLGRPWFDAGAKSEVIPRCMFYKCIFPDQLELKWVKMRKNHPDNYEMNYYKCKYQGEEVSSTNDLKLIDFYEKIYEQRR
ncbi:MAG: pectinesterase family protein [Anaeroplasmataceae bacterium]